MSEMIERIALAALALDDTIWVGDNQMLYFRRVAVAAIEEMRAASKSMCIAGGHVRSHQGDPLTDMIAERAWQAMCDEALK